MPDITFKDYYSYYMTLHRHPVNRALHVVGNITTVTYAIWCLYTHAFLLLFLTPLIVYPFAWSGHFFFEKNRPAAWSRPLWAKACDWLMIWDMLRGNSGVKR
jgi:hypothetical protein